MNSSVGDKIGKEGKSRKQAEENPNDEPLPANTTNQVDVVDAGVGSLPQGRSKAVGKRGKRKDGQLPRERKKSKHDLLSHRAVGIRGKHKDEQPSEKMKLELPIEVIEARLKYQRQLKESKGFDVDFIPIVHRRTFGGIRPVCAETLIEEHDQYKRFMEEAVDAYKGTDAYKDDDCGGQELEDLKMVKATQSRFNGTFEAYYITFTAKGSRDGLSRCYQARLTHTRKYRSTHNTWVLSVDFVRLKKERPHPH